MNSQLHCSSLKRANNHKGGGKAVFIHQLDFKIFKKLDNTNNNIKNLSVESLLDHSIRILVLVIYKLPDEIRLNS